MAGNLKISSREIPSEMNLIIDGEKDPDFKPASLGLLKGAFTLMGTPWSLKTATPIPSGPLHCLRFSGTGLFSGQINLRVAGSLLQADVLGSYKLWHNTTLDIIDGRLWAWIPDFSTINSFYLIRRAADRIDMVMRSSDNLADATDTDAPTVFAVTLKRITNPSWFDFSGLFAR